MSPVPWSAPGSLPPVDDSGKKTFICHFWKEEIERKSSQKVVSLRVPGTVDYQKPSSAPGVIRICQETHPQRKPRKKFTGFGFVVVPETSDLAALEKRQTHIHFQTSSSSSVPSIKRCTLYEIEAVKFPMEKNTRNATEKGRRCTQHPSGTPGHRGWASPPKTPSLSSQSPKINPFLHNLIENFGQKTLRRETHH